LKWQKVETLKTIRMKEAAMVIMASLLLGASIA